MIFVHFVLFFVIVNATDNLVPSTTDDKLPKETQRAQCTITAGDVQASAEATVTKTLEGVCGSDEIKSAFANLERRILLELQVIKEFLMRAHNVKLVTTQTTTSPKASSTTTSKVPNIFPTVHTLDKSSNIKFRDDYDYDDDIDDDEYNDDDRNKFFILKPKISRKNLRTPGNSLPRDSPREAEVKKLNNTMLSGIETKLFAYYWKLDKFSQKLKSNISVDYSPLFSILGKQLRIKAVINHLNREFLYLVMENASSMKGQLQSVFLETGNVFKKIHEKVHFKHKIAILDQAGTSNDLESQEFTSTEIGFSIPHSALISTTYLKNDTLLIKLIVYL